MTKGILKALWLTLAATAVAALAGCGSSGGGGGAAGVTSGVSGAGSGAGHAGDFAVLEGSGTQFFGTIDQASPSIHVVTGPGTAGYTDISALAYDPGKHVMYGFLYNENELVTVNPQGGGIAVLGPLAGAVRLQALAFDSGDGKLYGVDGDNVLVRVDPAALTVTAVGGGIGHSNAADLTYDPSSGVFYSIEARATVPGKLFTIDPATGAASDVGVLPIYLEELAIDTDSGRLYGLNRNTDTLAELDKTSGAVTATYAPMGFSHPADMEFVPAAAPGGGRLYTVARYPNVGGNLLVTIDPASGTGSAGAALGFDSIGGMAYDPAASQLYGVDTAGGRLLRIDTASGHGRIVGPLGFADVQGLAWDGTSGTLYGVDPVAGRLIRIDTSTGQGTAVGAGAITGDIRSLAFDTADGMLYGVDLGGGAGAQVVRIDPADATVTTIAAVTPPLRIESLGYDPADDALYGVAAGSDGLSHLWVWHFAGARQDVATPPVGFATGMAYDPAAGRLLANDAATGALVNIDPAAGSSVAVDHTGFVALHGLTYDAAAQRDYASTGAELVALDPITGAGTAIGPITGYQQVLALAYDGKGKTLYGYDSKQAQLLTIDPTTAAVTPVGGSGIPGIDSLAFDTANGRLYGSSGVQLYTIDPASGATAPLGGQATVDFTDLTYDPADATLYGVGSDGGGRSLLFVIDPNTGGLTLKQSYDYHIAALTYR